MQPATTGGPSGLSPRLLLLIGVLVAALAASGWFARQWLAGQEAGLDLFPPEPCDLRQGPCRAERGGRRLTFAIDGRNHGSHAPMALRVTLEGFTASQVAVELQGVEMFMGQNRFPLARQADGSYVGEGRLPVCTTGEMLWRARVLVTTPNGVTGSWFDFKAR